MSKIVKERRVSSQDQDTYEQLCTRFETAARLKPSHRLDRQQSLEKLRDELGYRRSSYNTLLEE